MELALAFNSSVLKVVFQYLDEDYVGMFVESPYHLSHEDRLWMRCINKLYESADHIPWQAQCLRVENCDQKSLDEISGACPNIRKLSYFHDSDTTLDFKAFNLEEMSIWFKTDGESFDASVIPNVKILETIGRYDLKTRLPDSIVHLELSGIALPIDLSYLKNLKTLCLCGFENSGNQDLSELKLDSLVLQDLFGRFDYGDFKWSPVPYRNLEMRVRTINRIPRCINLFLDTFEMSSVNPDNWLPDCLEFLATTHKVLGKIVNQKIKLPKTLRVLWILIVKNNTDFKTHKSRNRKRKHIRRLFRKLKSNATVRIIFDTFF